MYSYLSLLACGMSHGEKSVLFVVSGPFRLIINKTVSTPLGKSWSLMYLSAWLWAVMDIICTYSNLGKVVLRYSEMIGQEKSARVGCSTYIYTEELI